MTTKFDLISHLLRQMAWSHATFGPGPRTSGVIDHLRKELVEVEKSDGSPDEWVDVVILALDGLTRQLAYANGKRTKDPEYTVITVIDMLLYKQARNEARDWPDWRTSDPDKAIEHDRSDETETAAEPADDYTLEHLRGEVQSFKGIHPFDKARNWERATLIARIEKAEAERDALVEALTPSDDTKAAYMSEVVFEIISDDDEYGLPVPVSRFVHWTAIKEIMALIRNRACASGDG